MLGSSPKIGDLRGRSENGSLRVAHADRAMKPEDAAFFAWLMKRNIVPKLESSGIKALNCKRTKPESEANLRGSIASEQP